jgi:predicted transcriptional regulator
MRLARMQMRAAGLADQAKYHARRACARFVTATTFLYAGVRRGSANAKAGAFYSLAHCRNERRMQISRRVTHVPPCAWGWAVCGPCFARHSANVFRLAESESGNLKEYTCVLVYCVRGMDAESCL